MVSSEEPEETLEYTATWVVAGVCTVIVVISLAVERLLHYLGKFLKKSRQEALYKALQKLKEELMLLGFISLLLTVFQNRISRICVPASTISRMLPCKMEESKTPGNGHHYSKQLSHLFTHSKWRLLTEGSESNTCASKGKVPLLSLEALHHLHIFIFVLAVVHCAFSATTMVLGGARVRQWKHWEDAIKRENLRQGKSLTSEHQTTIRSHTEFVKERTAGIRKNSVVVSRMRSFLKQFYGSVTMSDYRALRSGFIMRHCSSNPNFDFHKYVMRALQDDFKVVVGISWYLWLFVVIFLLLNINGWHTYFWLSFLPMILLLVVGTKLEHIITRLAQEAADHPINYEGAMVKPSDHHFWFHKPGIVLYLIHFILFQNSFELAFLFWIWCTYGFKSCIVEKLGYIIPRIIIGTLVQVLCSSSTLPLYAIVTQMGDFFKQAIFAAQLRTSLHGWAEDARKRKRSTGSISSIKKVFTPKTKRSEASGSELQLKVAESEAAASSCSSHGAANLEGV